VKNDFRIVPAQIRRRVHCDGIRLTWQDCHNPAQSNPKQGACKDASEERLNSVSIH
jgi:hypothetical protein